MSLTASSLITAAKKRTFGSQGRQKVSDAMLLEELNYQDTQVVQMFSQIAPDLLARDTSTVTFTDSGNTNGYSLTDGIHYRDFTHVDTANDKYVPIRIIQRSDRERDPRPPAGMVRLSGGGANFYPVDPNGKRFQGDADPNYFNPDQGHKMTYSYVPEPGGLTALSDTLTSPDMAREVLVASLELQLLLSDSGGVPQALQQQHQQRIQAALAKRQGMWDSLRMQAYKFAHAQGSDALSRVPQSEAEWVAEQVGG